LAKAVLKCVLLCGGDKASQGKDIEKAKELAKEI
jgi:putative component of toxin-antitoxin plasmid stabilization module